MRTCILTLCNYWIFGWA